MRRWLLVAVVVVVWLDPAPALADWEHPVDAEVVDVFRPPASRFGAGNRGLEYGTVGGETVRAVDGGTVVFAGIVGRHRHVVIDHGQGLRSTYAYVRSSSVVRGQSVGRGQTIATADPGFHLTARLSEVHVDPLNLIGGAQVIVRLVPVDSPLRSVGSDRVRSSPDAGVPGSNLPRRPNPLLAAMDAADDLRLARQVVGLAATARDWYHHDCTEDGSSVGGAADAVPASNRILVQVGGLGSSSDGASIGELDHGAIGYDPEHVVGFSYAGGCTPEAFGGGRSMLTGELGATPYGPEDTFRPVDSSAAALADLVESIAAARPGQPIDIAAHSLGGVVTRRAVEMLDERGTLGPVDVVFTIGSPHGGADLATAAVATAGSGAAEVIIDPWIGEAAGFRDADSVIDIAEAGGGDLPEPSPPPEGVTVVAVAGGGDMVVTAEHATWNGATNVVVPTSLRDVRSVHGDLPRLPEVQREFELAIAGAAPRCVGLASVLGSALQGRGISAIEDGVTLLAGVARWVF